MKFYISSHSKELAQKAAARLRTLGHTVVSQWHDEEGAPPSDVESRDVAAVTRRFDRNRDDLYRADAVLAITSPDAYVPGGKHVEVGMALVSSRDIYLIDPALLADAPAGEASVRVTPVRENIGYYHPRVKLVSEWSEVPPPPVARSASSYGKSGGCM